MSASDHFPDALLGSEIIDAAFVDGDIFAEIETNGKRQWYHLTAVDRPSRKAALQTAQPGLILIGARYSRPRTDNLRYAGEYTYRARISGIQTVRPSETPQGYKYRDGNGKFWDAIHEVTPEQYDALTEAGWLNDWREV